VTPAVADLTPHDWHTRARYAAQRAAAGLALTEWDRLALNPIHGANPQPGGVNHPDHTIATSSHTNSNQQPEEPTPNEHRTPHRVGRSRRDPTA
jgi:hypothetical protein